MDTRAIVKNTISNTILDTIHQSQISELRLYSERDNQRKCEKISSVGGDGKMVIWDLKVRKFLANPIQISNLSFTVIRILASEHENLTKSGNC